MGYNIRDLQKKVTKALPSSASGTVHTDAIDTENSARGDFTAALELLISAPALTTTMLPDTKTCTYKIEHDTDSAFGTVADLYPSVIVQTGANSGGAAAATFRTKLPTNVKRYVRVAITLGSQTTDSSSKTATVELLA
jgi:hypothetical protein